MMSVETYVVPSMRPSNRRERGSEPVGVMIFYHESCDKKNKTRYRKQKTELAAKEI
jgi:hypothetical protein